MKTQNAEAKTSSKITILRYIDILKLKEEHLVIFVTFKNMI